MKGKLEVYEVRLSQVRSWTQGCYGADSRLKFATMDSFDPMVGDYLVVTCCSDFGAFDGRNDDEKVWFGGVYIYTDLDVVVRRVESGERRYFAKLADGSMNRGLEWEIWRVVPDDPKPRNSNPYYYAENEPSIFSDDTYFTEADTWATWDALHNRYDSPRDRVERYVLVESLESLSECKPSARRRHYWLYMCDTETQAQRLFWHKLTEDCTRGVTHLLRLRRSDAFALLPDAFRPSPLHGDISFDTDPVDHLVYHSWQMELCHG